MIVDWNQRLRVGRIQMLGCVNPMQRRLGGTCPARVFAPGAHLSADTVVGAQRAPWFAREKPRASRARRLT
jgi:hypothetical protein